jgi:nucleoside-diphosphate-sugar epimerase
MKIALTGATGLLGGPLVRELLARGHELRALARPGARRPEPAGPRLSWIEGGLEDTTALDELVRGADAVLHAAYMHPEAAGASSLSTAQHYVQANFSASMRLLEHTSGLSAKQFVYVSSLAVYGHAPDEDPRGERYARDEDFPLWPTQFYGAMRSAVETMVIAAAHAYALNASCFRLGCLLGWREAGPATPFSLQLEEARGWGELRTCEGAYVLSAEDAARILAAAMGDSRVAGGVYNCFDRWFDFASIAPQLGELLGRELVRTAPLAREPRSPILNDRLRARYAEFDTEDAIRRLLERLVTQAPARRA